MIPSGRACGKVRDRDERFPDRRLTGLCTEGLRVMFDPDRNLFCFRATRTEEGLRNEGHSLRYTIISLLGLSRFEEHGGLSPVPIPAVLPAVWEEARSIDNLGDLGLLLWLCASASPERLGPTWERHRGETALDRFPEGRQGRTMELAWFLAGLSHAAAAGGRGLPGLERAAASAFGNLRGNCGGQGIFLHVRRSTLPGFIRGRIGNFADQVYPIYALARYFQAFGDRRALELCRAASLAICSLQGSLGQWWWHYDAARGSVVGRYPVYSVHQDGMAPMALSAAEEVSPDGFLHAAALGFRWIEGNNELEAKLIDPERNVIWRCLDRAKHRRAVSELLAMVFRSGRSREFRDLWVRYECRPYHLGWLLYAYSGRHRSGLFAAAPTPELPFEPGRSSRKRTGNADPQRNAD